MPKHDMEDIFRKKLEDFEPQHRDRWEQIAAALPEEKKRRGAFWLWFGMGMALLIGVVAVVLYTQSGTDTVVVATETEQKPQPQVQPLVFAESLAGEDSEGGKDPAHAEGGIGAISSVSTKTTKLEPTEVLPLTPSKGGIGIQIQPEPVEQTDPSDLSDNILDDPKEVLPITTPDPEEFFTINADGDTIRVRKPVKIVDTMSPHRTYRLGYAANGRWAMGFGMGISSSYFDQRMPKTQGNTAIEQQGMVQRNQALREKMEQPGIAFSQSLWIQYQPHYNWSFNTGISMVQTTQNLAFNIKSQVPDPYRGPADFPEAGTTGPSGQYLFPEDSILPGNGYTATNKYFSREIPFYVNYHLWLSQKFQVQVSAGAAYRWVTGASVYFADIDNVGMIYMNGPEYYPGLRGTWNIQGGIALNYQINGLFSLNVMPGFQYAVQSNIRHEHYVQQYQRQWGLQVRLSRKLGF